jgi:signal transduction histidine kinase
MKTLTKDRQKKSHYHSHSRFRDPQRDLDFSLPRRMALIDSEGNIVAVDDDCIGLARDGGAPFDRVGPGVNYLDVCRQAMRSAATSRKAVAGIEAVLKGKIASFAMDYSCQTSAGLAYFRMNVTPIAYGNARVAIAHTDITDLQLSKEEDFKRLRQFARRLIHAQEEERQRISRELHDDLGHRIALMSFSVRQIMKQHPKNFASGMRDLNKIVDGITDLSTAMRNLSHCLYPPQLQYLGIKGALKSLSEEFDKTYGIHIDLVVPEEAPRFPAEIELCIYRILQESLQNIAKHSGAGRVKIVLENTTEEIRLTISDTGRGFNRSAVMKKGGLGLLSMEERALSIGADLTVNSSPDAGTEICLSIPLQEDIHVYA